MAKSEDDKKRENAAKDESKPLAPEEPKQEKAKEEKQPDPKSKVRYFRNRRFAKESINYDSFEDSVGRTIFKRETFVGYKRRVMGEEEPFGYLATTNPAVVRVCLATSHIDEIDEDEYKAETDEKNNKIRRF